MRRFEEIFMMTFILLALIGMMVIMAYIFIGFGDSFSLEEVGEESVPCLDKYNRPFEDEMCTKTITCSKLGIAGDKKCDALHAISETKKDGGKNGK